MDQWDSPHHRPAASYARVRVRERRYIRRYQRTHTMRVLIATLASLMLAAPCSAQVQSQQTKGSRTSEYQDTEFTSQEVKRVIISLDQGCSVSTWKSDYGPACWYYSDDLTYDQGRVKAVIGPAIHMDQKIDDVAYATWIGLPVVIDGGTSIIYTCPANKFITVGTITP